MFFILMNALCMCVGGAPEPLALVPGTTDIYRRWDPPTIAKGSLELATRYANNLKSARIGMTPERFDGGILAWYKNHFVFLPDCVDFNQAAADELIGLYAQYVINVPRPPVIITTPPAEPPLTVLQLRHPLKGIPPALLRQNRDIVSARINVPPIRRSTTAAGGEPRTTGEMLADIDGLLVNFRSPSPPPQAQIGWFGAGSFFGRTTFSVDDDDDGAS